MKITIIDPAIDEEEEIIIKCHHVDDQTLKLINSFKTGKENLVGLKDGKIYFMIPQDIFYFEAVDNKVFIYCKESIFESKLKLYEIENLYGESDFFRASKSTILNLSQIKSLSPAFNGRFEALLKNNERTIISRQYVPELKKKLGL
ncbi:MAG: LytTR family DNA-binding domain-containing protein [Cellulosilyticaceae bacterium]